MTKKKLGPTDQERKQLRKEILEERVKSLEKTAITYERRVQTAKREIERVDEALAKKQKITEREIATDLSKLRTALNQRTVALQAGEEQMSQRKANLASRERAVANLNERQKELRNKAMIIESRGNEVEGQARRASKDLNEISNKLAEEKRIREANILKDRDVTEKLDKLNVKIAQQENSEKNSSIARVSYEEIKKEIDPKLLELAEKEKLVKSLNEKNDLKEKDLQGRETQNQKMLEFISSQKEKLDREEARLKVLEIDINTKAMRAKIDV